MTNCRAAGIVLTLGLAAMNSRGYAAVPDRDWPSVEVTPAIDVPMRDAAIARGTNGTYYLTGTLGPDFENARQIKLWKSGGLKAWEEVGVVWDLEKDFGKSPYEAVKWMRTPRMPLDGENRPIAQGITSPELHFVKGDWYICFSMNGEGTGLLKSTSGKPEGPYVGWSQITVRHGDPSMFEDDDGGVYWLFGGGWIARMSDDLRMLAEPPRLLQPAPDPRDTRNEKWLKGRDTKGYLSDYPLQVGRRGAFLFKHLGRYYLCAADYSTRLGVRCDDTYVAYADSLYGPYSARHLMVPHGGAVTVFKGPNTSAVGKYRGPYVIESGEIRDGEQLYASFYGDDPRAIFRDRPAFLPLEWSSRWRWDVELWGRHESFPRKPQHVFTERGPWSRMKPVLTGEEMRDMGLCVAPDGFYYLSGSVMSRPGTLALWRSKDLTTWEEQPPIWRYEDIDWLNEKILPVPKYDPAKVAWQHVFWDCRILPRDGTYYVTYDIFMRDDKPEHRGAGALKSTSGKIEGPYVSLGRVGGQLGKDAGPIIPGFFTGPDGKLYACNWLNWKRVVAEADLAVPGWKWNYRPVDGGIFMEYTICDPFGVKSVLDTFVFATAGNGRLNGYEPSNNTTYDVNYMTARTPWGPPVGAMRTLPHCSAGTVFRDRNGYWWSTYFGSDHTGPWWQQIGLVPLTVEKQGEEIVIEAQGKPDEYQLKIMGGGAPAVVKTVPATLE